MKRAVVIGPAGFLNAAELSEPANIVLAWLDELEKKNATVRIEITEVEPSDGVSVEIE